MEGEAEQTFFIVLKRLAVRDVEKSPGFLAVAVLRENQDFAGLLNHKKTPGTIRRFLQPQWAAEFYSRKSGLKLQGRDWFGGKRARKRQHRHQAGEAREQGGGYFAKAAGSKNSVHKC